MVRNPNPAIMVHTEIQTPNGENDFWLESLARSNEIDSAVNSFLI